jgi:hypothetical protein
MATTYMVANIHQTWNVPYFSQMSRVTVLILIHCMARFHGSACMQLTTEQSLHKALHVVKQFGL